MVGQNRPSAVELLHQQDPHHGVRQGQVRQTDQVLTRLPNGWVKAIWPTNDEGHVLGVGLPAQPTLRQGDRGQALPFFVQPDLVAVFRNSRVNAGAFSRPNLGGGA